ncbi:MAG: DUF1517 domain-containing protein [cyanobacterium endosymbiont of Epithemia adnata isolate EadnSB Bon19]|jgi:hypothetical protein|uniref:DUF1517 domain-containing protein n=1 Tax=cyanobacterium endosymbiont of Epithemia turgida TaxID=718217 RepID=UPI0004D1C61A|nr:DUF1517 domain-containing protein [cyanobacterium endosymbiont of Epithemia turgida]BAP17409.1 hypothetical protein ETSB_0568 [cyanobacterium endosymbiont of Epithemia turgida isolate EtSB Lake Yunoko]
MSSLGNRFNKLTGKNRFVVSRIFIHLAGDEVAPLLGVLNQTAQNALESEGDLGVLGEGLVSICQKLLEMSIYWRSAANEGDVFWKEEEAGDYITELFTDSAQRYLSEPEFDSFTSEENVPLSLPMTRNVVVMIIVAFKGEAPELETSLDDRLALEKGLKALINLNYQGILEAIQVHFSPARLGDELTNDQLLLNFSELISL